MKLPHTSLRPHGHAIKAVFHLLLFGVLLTPLCAQTSQSTTFPVLGRDWLQHSPAKSSTTTIPLSREARDTTSTGLSPIPVPAYDAISPGAQEERDTILSLGCLDVVFRNWQTNASTRGHNIGCLIVDSNSIPVGWNVNCVAVLNNGTQHGEVRATQQFFNSTNASGKYLVGYSIYSSMEPCAMCTGMLTMVQLKRCVYVQVDPGYGNAIKGLKDVGYPRVFEAYTPVRLQQKIEMEAEFDRFRITNKSITDYLLTPSARKIYASAENDLMNYRVKWSQENAEFYNRVTNYIATEVNPSKLKISYETKPR